MQRGFFHGGGPGLEIGGHIVPPTETGWEYPAGRRDRVCVTSDLMQAVCCARHERG
jgi:hypothetical protein